MSESANETVIDAADSAATVVLVAGLLDESGSMLNVHDETISGYNGFVATIRAEQAGKLAYLSTFTFDSRQMRDAHGKWVPAPVLRTVVDGTELATAPELTRASYSPEGGTPLYDAIGLAIRQIDAIEAAKSVTHVTFVIQTDGLENASREFRLPTIQAAIEVRRVKGWQIIFLGADLANARELGMNLGVSPSNSMGYSKGSTEAAFFTMGSASSLYRETKSADKKADLTLTPADKAKIGDNS